MRSASHQNGIDFETFEPKWWDVYMRSVESDIETLDSDDDEGDERNQEQGSGSSEDDANPDEEEFIDAVETQSS